MSFQEQIGRDLGEQLTRFWTSLGLKIRAGAPATALAQFETRYGVVLPPDMRGYFGVVDGMEDELDDQRMIRFWPLGDVQAVGELPEAFARLAWYAGYFLFADFLLWSHGYAIRFSADARAPNPIVLVDSERGPLQVATSFSDFVGRYLDPVLWCGLV